MDRTRRIYTNLNQVYIIDSAKHAHIALYPSNLIKGWWSQQADTSNTAEMQCGLFCRK